MENNSNKVITLTLFIFGIIFMIAGSTFAYFNAGISSNANDLKGSTYNFSVAMNITNVKNDELIPVVDDLIDDTLNSTHICTDVRGYGLCHLYQITLTNNGEAATMTGYLETVSTTYTTSNLKYQLFTYANNTYTAASDMKTVPTTAGGTSNFTLSNTDVSVALNNGTTSSYSTDYYLVIWLSDPGNNQLVDSNKTYNGRVTFVASTGDRISANFS